MFWITKADRTPLIKEVEQQTCLAAMVAQGDPRQWKKSIEHARVVVLCLPIETDTMQEVLAAVLETERRVPVIAIDPDRVLDESLVLAPMTRFHHVTSLDVNEISRRILAVAIPCGWDQSEMAIDSRLKAMLVGE